ncbi:PREDICTED: ribonuclease Oy [Cyphomyrmex costatus]|uniref:Ribonuclease Oy n=1 Tax=Cyphomyrmex costatus TaxID=456900 RepID=A0A195D0W7_9HYME|nr:PREDICTED: ribonuclease Oy [Cyphomyrmex costatus]KYN06507.1 Ribonuclease Oy [Cyphomyrmex costatus]
MYKYSIVSCIVLIYLLCITHGRWIGRKNIKQKSRNEYDVLIFTQRWPLTTCFVWESQSRPNETHSCSLPKRNQWTIHGIWPTIYNEIGPQFCNNSLSFNSTALAPIENELKQNWLDIQKGSKPYSFWKHEWDKHGTCAISVQELNSEFKYFQTALKLLDNYNMINILAKANILPGNRYTVQNYLTGIKKVLNKRGQVMCVVNQKTKTSYVEEIRICFNKTLQLVDCDGIYKFPTNCNRSQEIVYPNIVPHYYVKQT